MKIAHPRLRPGGEAQLTFMVREDGEPVTALQPYLGAYGHLVALRKADLAYPHVHPTGHASRGTITFAAEFPTASAYRRFLQFRSQGRVETAPFTLDVSR